MTSLRGWVRWLGLLFFWMIFAVAHAAGSLELTEQERAWIAANPVVVVGVRSDIEPLEYVDNGKVRGLVGEYLQAISRFTGLRFVVKSATGKTISQLGWLQDGTVDMFPLSIRNIGPMADAKGVLFTSPYYINTTIIVSRAGTSAISELADLDGKVIALSQYSRLEQRLREAVPNIRVVNSGSARDTLEMVATGKADAAVGLDGFLAPYVAGRYDGILQISGVLGSISAELSMAVSDRQPILYAIVQKALVQITAADAHEMNHAWLAEAKYGEPSWAVLLEHYRSQGALLVVTFVILAGLVQSFRRAHRRALRSEREKAMFLAVMSHEIRSPMNAVLASVELLQRTPLDGEQRRLADLANSGANTLLRLLNDVLDISKLEAGKFVLERGPTDIAALVREVVDLYQLQAANKGVKVSMTVPDDCGRLMLDATRMSQILHNLVSNAIKFTGSGEVTVAVVFTPQEVSKGVLEILVSDTGIGIAKEAQGALFQPYTQVGKSQKKGQRGTGLGLRICRELVTRMHGEIVLNSALGVGTSVTVSLPVAVAKMIDVPVVESHAPDAHLGDRRLSILLVEDMPANQYVIQEQLASLGCDASLAGDGAQARQAFQLGGYDLVLMDCDLPDTDGYALTREFRAYEAEHSFARCSIIAISAAMGSEHTMRCLDAGMDGILSKPIRLAKLQDTIEIWCRSVLTQEGSEQPVEVVQVPSLASDFVQKALQDDLLALRGAMEAADLPLSRHYSHRLRGVSVTIGLTSLAKLSGEIEHLASTGADLKAENAVRLFDALVAELNRLVSFMKDSE